MRRSCNLSPRLRSRIRGSERTGHLLRTRFRYEPWLPRYRGAGSQTLSQRPVSRRNRPAPLFGWRHEITLCGRIYKCMTRDPVCDNHVCFVKNRDWRGRCRCSPPRRKFMHGGDGNLPGQIRISWSKRTLERPCEPKFPHSSDE